MSDVSKLNINGTDYDIKDGVARAAIQSEFTDLAMDEKLEIIKNRLDNALADTNTALVTKGATEVTKFDEVPEAIESIQSGGGEDTLDIWLNRTLVSYRNDNVQTLWMNYIFANQPYLTSIDLPRVWRPYDYAFQNCPSLKNVNLPKAIYIGSFSHENNTSLESVSYPSAATIYRTAFKGCTNLKKVDIGVTMSFAGQNAFQDCSSFDTFILRGNEVSALSNINNFNGGAFNEGGTGGTIYVPSALIEAYKTATNWSVLYEAGRCNFVAIEGSEYE